VRIDGEHDHVRIIVVDDGRGGGPSTPSTQGFGLVGIRTPELDGIEVTRRLAGPDVSAPLAIIVITTCLQASAGSGTSSHTNASSGAVGDGRSGDLADQEQAVEHGDGGLRL
jgi:hypothetical protein